jgi:hypothetical protein
LICFVNKKWHIKKYASEIKKELSKKYTNSPVLLPESVTPSVLAVPISPEARPVVVLIIKMIT